MSRTNMEQKTPSVDSGDSKEGKSSGNNFNKDTEGQEGLTPFLIFLEITSKNSSAQAMARKREEGKDKKA